MCSQAENLKVQAGLRKEISVLTSELAELRAALEVLQEKLNRPADIRQSTLRQNSTYSEAMKSKQPAAASTTQHIVNATNHGQPTS